MSAVRNLHFESESIHTTMYFKTFNNNNSNVLQLQIINFKCNILFLLFPFINDCHLQGVDTIKATAV